jgi:uncharacterized protein YkwD
MKGMLERGLLVLTLTGLMAGCGTLRPPAEAQNLTVSERSEVMSWDGFDPQRLSRAIFEETNRVRGRHHLKALGQLSRLDAAADLQSDTNALIGETSHHNPMAGLARSADRVLAQGLRPRAVWENVGATVARLAEAGAVARVVVTADGERLRFDPQTGEPLPWPTYAEAARRIVQQYMDSPRHRDNVLLREATHLGCGTALSRDAMGAELLHSTQVFIQLPSRR